MYLDTFHLINFMIVFEMNLFNLLFVFATLITICMTERCNSSNSVIMCDDYSSMPSNYWFCVIFAGNNSDIIRDVIKNCTSEEYRHKTTLDIYKFATFDVPLTVELDVGQYVTDIYFYFAYPGNIFQVRSTKTHPSVSRMIFISEEFILPQSNIFGFFPNLNEVITISSRLLLNSLPSFQNNTNLTNLDLSIKVGNGFTLDANLTLGLSSLTRLSLTNSGIQSITPDALDTVIGLTELILQNNQIQHLPARVFEKLTNLETLDLGNNLITSSSPDAFFGLDSLSRLSLRGNKYFPVNVISPLSNLEYLILSGNNYTTLNPFTFQQLSYLTLIDLTDNPLDCDCELQWMSYVANYGIFVEGALCASPSSLMGSNATTPGIYSGCGSLEEFTCFNKSVTCPYNQVCQNLEYFHFCCCPEDYRMIDTGNCVVDTQFRIPNQTLSHNFNGCGCTQGYQRSPVSTNCVDIDECAIQNTGCEHLCHNTQGSYFCSCYEGFNFSSTDLHVCQSLNSQTIFTNPTLSITAIGIIFLLLILLIIQTIVCAILICCMKLKSIEKTAFPSASNPITNQDVSYFNQYVPGSTDVEASYVEMSPVHVKTDSGTWKEEANKVEIEIPYCETVLADIVYGEVENPESHYVI